MSDPIKDLNYFIFEVKIVKRKHFKMSEEGHRVTEALLVEAIGLQHGLNPSEAEKQVSIKQFTVSEGSNKGDNLMCILKVNFKAVYEDYL